MNKQVLIELARFLFVMLLLFITVLLAVDVIRDTIVLIKEW